MEYIWNCIIFLYLVEVVLTQEQFFHPIFNTMTPYFWVKDINESISDNEDGTFVYGGHSCNIKSLNLLFRHSARYPSLNWINKMNELHKNLTEDPLVLTKHQFISNWTNPFPENKQYSQSTLGDQEMLNLSTRFGKRFKSLFHEHIDDVWYAVTYKKRTQSSQAKFFEGLMELFITSTKSVSYNNTLLRFYEFCKKYTEDVDENKNSRNEFYKFLTGKEMKAVTDNVNLRLGGLHKIDTDDVVTIQQICAFELGMFRTSHWCQFLDMDDLLTIDYLLDLRNYWEMGYGYDINWQVSCPYTSEIFRRFNMVIDPEFRVPPQININFGHTDTILPVYTAFRLFKDSQNLLADNFDINKNRKFRASSIDPFSANFGVALYKCDSEYVVKLFVNEELIINPACNNTICTYKEFNTFYSDLANCNFDEICENYTNNGVQIIPDYIQWFMLVLFYSLS